MPPKTSHNFDEKIVINIECYGIPVSLQTPIRHGYTDWLNHVENSFNFFARHSGINICDQGGQPSVSPRD